MKIDFLLLFPLPAFTQQKFHHHTVFLLILKILGESYSSADNTHTHNLSAKRNNYSIVSWKTMYLTWVIRDWSTSHNPYCCISSDMVKTYLPSLDYFFTKSTSWVKHCHKHRKWYLCTSMECGKKCQHERWIVLSKHRHKKQLQ